MENKTYILEDLRELARRAYHGTSFSPEKRGDSVVSDYSAELEQDLADMPAEHRARYTENYRRHLSAYLSSHSRVYSSMIAGPSNFPVRRMEKLNRFTDNKYELFRAWREKALNAIARYIKNSRTPEQVVNEEWERMRKKILRSAGTIVQIDAGEYPGSRPLFVNSLVGIIKTAARNGQTELVKMSLDLVRELNSKSPKSIISAKNSVWALEEKVEAVREAIVDQAAKEPDEFEANGIKMVYNYGADRVQIFFDSKEQAMKYKAAGMLTGWNWSPTNGAWQRKLTDNGKYSGKQILAKII